MAASKNKALGRGLGALIPGARDNVEKGTHDITTLPLSLLEPNENQPRKSWDKEKLEALADSIRMHGIIQPLVVRKLENSYQIVAGERRWRAAQIAGLQEVPVFFFEGTEKDVQEISLIENIQREDLSPVEVARAIKELLDSFSLTQEDLAQRIGWSRTLLTNKLRLLQLPEELRNMIDRGEISEGHGRTLLGLETENQMLALAQRVVRDGISVRKLEEMVKKLKTDSQEKITPVKHRPQEDYPQSVQLVTQKHGVNMKISGAGIKKKLSIEGLTISQIEMLAKLIEESADILFPGK